MKPNNNRLILVTAVTLLLAGEGLMLTGCSSKKATVKDTPASPSVTIVDDAEATERNYHHGSQIPKRQFRGAWIQIVNGQFSGLSTSRMQATLTHQLDELQKDGVNAIIFQVRGECDAMYPSSLEPWSRFLTGKQGQAPSPYWDPLQWMIDQCHARGMELHAWINPYRAKMKGNVALAANHIAKQHPERFFKYDGLYILNPALQENRDYICTVVKDIVGRYDVDGLHIDDYFYPYPVAGVKIPDDADFRRSGQAFASKGDFRRHNVDLFIEQLGKAIHEVKPWVKFGVSPFGIYRNQTKAYQEGSKTNGLQNYDDLYADVLKWDEQGWVDYIVPQLYWQVGHKSADYGELIGWWNSHIKNRPLFIGEDVERTIKYADPTNAASNQVPTKHKLHQQNTNVQGTVLWYAKSAVDNYNAFGSFLRNYYWNKPALQPAMLFLNDKAPKKPAKLKAEWTAEGYLLKWEAPKHNDWKDEAAQYVVYRFQEGEIINIDDPSFIVEITEETAIQLPYSDGKTKFTYIVTALGKTGNESRVSKCEVKL